MALFEYRCNACGHVFEALVHSTDDGPACPTCGSKDLEKMLSHLRGEREGFNTSRIMSQRGLLRRLMRTRMNSGHHFERTAGLVPAVFSYEQPEKNVSRKERKGRKEKYHGFSLCVLREL